MKLDFSDAMVKSEQLRRQAQAMLEDKLCTNPADTEALWHLAGIQRQNGDLEGSAGMCQRLLDVDPSNILARRLLAILTGDVLLETNEIGYRIAPFARFHRVFAKKELAIIRRFIDNNVDAMGASRVGQNTLRPEYRSSRIIEKDIAAQLPFILDEMKQRVRSLWDRLELQPFEPAREELQFTRHGEGEFYKLHTDVGTEDFRQGRKITFVYYIHTIPRQFEGGDLMLFDTNVEKNSVRSSYTRLEPVHNSVVFFPSCYYHQVTPVSTQSKDPRDGRFTLNGWIHDMAYENEPGFAGP